MLVYIEWRTIYPTCTGSLRLLLSLDNNQLKRCRLDSVVGESAHYYTSFYSAGTLAYFHVFASHALPATLIVRS